MDNPQPLITEGALKHWMRENTHIYYFRDQEGMLSTCNAKAFEWIVWQQNTVILIAHVKQWKIKFKNFE
jgi:hypothetical protein